MFLSCFPVGDECTVPQCIVFKSCLSRLVQYAASGASLAASWCSHPRQNLKQLLFGVLKIEQMKSAEMTSAAGKEALDLLKRFGGNNSLHDDRVLEEEKEDPVVVEIKKALEGAATIEELACQQQATHRRGVV